MHGIIVVNKICGEKEEEITVEYKELYLFILNKESASELALS